jgi:hypothetical protein
MKVSEIIANANPQPVIRGRNLYKIGWASGYLVVSFRGRDTIYIYGIPGVGIPEVERDTLIRVRYPDKLFANHLEKKGWQTYIVEVKRDRG